MEEIDPDVARGASLDDKIRRKAHLYHAFFASKLKYCFNKKICADLPAQDDMVRRSAHYAIHSEF